ncbi:hypothetical protein R6Z07F_015990 [Ovis aries]
MPGRDPSPLSPHTPRPHYPPIAHPSAADLYVELRLAARLAPSPRARDLTPCGCRPRPGGGEVSPAGPGDAIVLPVTLFRGGGEGRRRGAPGEAGKRRGSGGRAGRAAGRRRHRRDALGLAGLPGAPEGHHSEDAQPPLLALPGPALPVPEPSSEQSCGARGRRLAGGRARKRRPLLGEPCVPRAAKPPPGAAAKSALRFCLALQ